MRSAGEFRVDFLVPGFSKCGTTTLCDLLAEHPQIFIPPGEGKEPLYFIRPEYRELEPVYRAFFASATESQLLGEGSTFYSSHQHDTAARDRIFEHNPGMRFIWIARDPLDRIVSSFREFHHSGHRFAVEIPFAFDEALEEVPALIRDSSYWARLNVYRERFADEQMLIVLLEELRADPRGVLRECYRFLGVDADFRNRDPHLRMNTGETKLRDTRLLRWLRRNRLLSARIAAMSPVSQDKLFRRLGLRRPFRGGPRWTERGRERVLDELLADALQFLAHAGREPAQWPSLAAAASGRGVS